MRQVLDELESAVELAARSKKRQHTLVHHAVELATYIAEHGFVDYAVRTSKLAAEFALRAGYTEAAAHWAEVQRESLELAGEVATE